MELSLNYLYEKLFENVSKMRTFQKGYFQHKDKYHLEQSKKYERIVDQILFYIEKKGGNA